MIQTYPLTSLDYQNLPKGETRKSQTAFRHHHTDAKRSQIHHVAYDSDRYTSEEINKRLPRLYCFRHANK